MICQKLSFTCSIRGTLPWKKRETSSLNESRHFLAEWRATSNRTEASRFNYKKGNEYGFVF